MTCGASEVYVFTPKGDVIALPDRLDAGRLRLRGAHRGRASLHRRAGQRQAGRARSRRSTTATPSRCSRRRPRTPARRATGSRSSSHPRARTKIRQWFAKERREDAIDAGKTALSKAMRKAALPMQRLLGGDQLLTLAREMHLADVAALYAAIGEGHVSAQSVVQKLVDAARWHRGRDRGHRRGDDAGAGRAVARRRTVRPATPASSSRASATSG